MEIKNDNDMLLCIMYEQCYLYVDKDNTFSLL